ncbi:F-box DNA helicase 1-like, partial [Malurus melanocephalus]|uniref:F-box DNA helicase 1-like n=1 Tax=Malurus melanocephalus TaxID=175006 RepID=UPI0025470748
MERLRRRRLTAPECEALAQSAEGSAPLTQPLSRARETGNRNLHPIPRRRHPKGPGQQRKILEFFGTPKTPQTGSAGTTNCGIKDEPLDPFFPESDNSFGIMENPSSNPTIFPDNQNLVPPPKAHSRKRPHPSASSGIPNAEQHPWGDPDGEIPERSRIKQEWEELEVEPIPDSHFGLLGTRDWEIPQGKMDELPVEILRNIFSFLPLSDLYLNVSLVCHYWREIIRDPL